MRLAIQVVNHGRKKPMYARIQSAIRRQILSGELNVGQKMPSVEDLCSKYSVSPITIRRSMELLAEENLIERIPGTGTFVKRTSGESKAEESATICLVVANLYGDFPGAIVTGVESALSQAGCKTQIYLSNNSYKREREHLEQILREGAAGVIIFGVCLETVNPNCDILLEVKRSGIPLVMVDTYLPSLDIDHVVSDDFKGSYSLAKHFIDLGHNDIGYIRAPEEVTSVQARFAGYQAAMADNDLPVKSKYVFSAEVLSDHHGYYSERGYQALLEYIKSLENDLPTAFLCYTDGIAISLFRVLFELGIDVPGRVAIGGFGGGYEPAMFQIPLTTVLQPRYELGERATKLILERIKNPSMGAECQHISLPTKLVVKGSSGIKKDHCI